MVTGWIFVIFYGKVADIVMSPITFVYEMF
jgi:hypothetical protein